MQTSEGEAITIARDLIRQHGTRAVHVAVERLNEMIDSDDWRGRDLWARVVHAIHEAQGSSAEATTPDESR
ncbi:MAG TPA: hypothetical protein VHU15_02690 [Stellaceae bacterium]|jgi:hypothetical protein|nr:hypothetical protein [Stellaceae bacterium]